MNCNLDTTTCVTRVKGSCVITGSLHLYLTLYNHFSLPLTWPYSTLDLHVQSPPHRPDDINRVCKPYVIRNMIYSSITLWSIQLEAGQGYNNCINKKAIDSSRSHYMKASVAYQNVGVDLWSVYWIGLQWSIVFKEFHGIFYNTHLPIQVTNEHTYFLFFINHI